MRLWSNDSMRQAFGSARAGSTVGFVGVPHELVDAAEQVERIGAQSSKRLAKSDEERIPARVVLMGFEAAEPATD